MKSDYPKLQVPEHVRRKMGKFAREFRKEPIKSQRILWSALPGKKLDGLKFRRQQPVGTFIVDFYNSYYRLVIEVDGSIHDFQKDADHKRQVILETLGLNVLRVKSELVEQDLPAVLNMIRKKINVLKSSRDIFSSPNLGEGKSGG